MIQLNPVLCEETNRIQISLIHFGHAVLGTWWQGELEALDSTQLYYVLSGSGKVLSGDRLLTMEAGNWYLLPSGIPIKYWCEDSMEEFSFHLKLCNIDRIDLLQHCQAPCQLAIREDITEFLFHCLGSHDPLDGIRLRQAIDAVLLSFIDAYHITFENKELSPCVSKAINYINNHLSMYLTVEQIVKNAYVSKSTLEMRFKEELHTSVHKYLYDAIMFEAGQLLQKSNLSVRAISEKFGFCDQFYFSKSFKNKFGKSPRDFRNTVPM